MNASTKAMQFLESLTIPTGPLAGQPVKLAPFQKKFIRGALAKGIDVGVLSVGRGNGKSTTLSAGLSVRWGGIASPTASFSAQRREVHHG
jgi:phage terminase large subunit-like protein